MKRRFLLLILTICASFLLISCGKEDTYKPLKDANLAEVETIDEDEAEGKYDMSVLGVIYDISKVPNSFWAKQVPGSTSTYEDLYSEIMSDTLGHGFGILKVPCSQYSSFSKLGENVYKILMNNEGWLYTDNLYYFSTEKGTKSAVFYALRTDMSMVKVELTMESGFFYQEDVVSDDWKLQTINKWNIYDTGNAYRMFYKLTDEYYLTIKVDKMDDLDSNANNMFCKKLAFSFCLDKVVRKEGSECASIDEKYLQYNVENKVVFDFRGHKLQEWRSQNNIDGYFNVISVYNEDTQKSYSIQEYEDLTDAKTYVDERVELYEYTETEYNGVKVFVEHEKTDEEETLGLVNGLVFTAGNRVYVVYENYTLEKDGRVNDIEAFMNNISCLSLGK